MASRPLEPGGESTGLEHRTPYALRHTFASFAIAAGVSLFELSRFMGTSVEQIDRTYGHLLPDSLDGTRTAIDSFVSRRSVSEDARRADDFSPLRCVGCGTTAFDPRPGAEKSPERVLSLQRMWVMAQEGGTPGPAYAVCNACWDRNIGFLWADDETLSRVWYVEDPESA